MLATPLRRLVAATGDTDGQAHCLVMSQALVANLHLPRIEVHDRADQPHRTILPRRDILERGVGDERDQGAVHPDAVQRLADLFLLHRPPRYVQSDS